MSASTSPEGTRRLVHELYAAGRVRGASILTVRDGKIAGVTDYYDMATFLTQLGGIT